MFQEIEPYCYDNHYSEILPDNNSYIVFIRKRAVLVKKEDKIITLPTFSELNGSDFDSVYLFSIGDKHFFLALGASEGYCPNSYDFIELSALRALSPRYMCFAAVTAYQLGFWYESNRYCGRCGNKTKRDKIERMLYCEDCKNIIYPKICPAVIVALTDGDKILLTKYEGRPNSNRYALIAGYTEIGETVEDTVRREVMEEVGLKVKNIRYYKSQPWSFSDTILLGFFCELDGSNEITLDRNELSVAEWTERKDMPATDDVSLTCEMMRAFIEMKQA